MQDGEALHCSFCRKSQDSVQKLITSPNSDPSRAYICDECVMVCASILEDDRLGTVVSHETFQESGKSHPLLNHPLTPQLLAAVERWITEVSLGADAAEAFAEVRATAIRWMRPGP
jgi:hypothetical protein